MTWRGLHAKVSQAAATTIRLAAGAAAPWETGGILLGWWHPGGIVVELAVEITDPDATGCSWTRHESAAQAALEAALRDADHPWLGYVGDWHTHSAPCGASPTDLAAIQRASRQYSEPVLLLVHRSDGSFDGHAAKRGRRRRVTIARADEGTT